MSFTLTDGLGLANFASGLTQGVFNATSKLGLKRQLRYYNYAADDDMNRRIKLWNMENEYNTPAAQMSRYKAAGLNPNLIYGSGSASAGNASGFPSASGQKFDAPSPLDLQSGFQGYQQMRMLKSNLEVNDSVKARNDAAAAKDNAIARNYDRYMDSQIRSIESSIRRNDAVSALNLSQKDHQELVNTILRSTQENEIELSKIKVKAEQTTLNTALYHLKEIAPLVAAKYRIDIQHVDKKISELETRMGLNRAQATCAYSLAELYAARKYNQDIANHYAKDRELYDFGVYIHRGGNDSEEAFNRRMDAYREEWYARQSSASIKQAEENFRRKYGFFPIYETTSGSAKIGPVSASGSHSYVEAGNY